MAAGDERRLFQRQAYCKIVGLTPSTCVDSAHRSRPCADPRTETLRRLSIVLLVGRNQCTPSKPSSVPFTPTDHTPEVAVAEIAFRFSRVAPMRVVQLTPSYRRMVPDAPATQMSLGALIEMDQRSRGVGLGCSTQVWPLSVVRRITPPSPTTHASRSEIARTSRKAPAGTAGIVWRVHDWPALSVYRIVRDA